MGVFDDKVVGGRGSVRGDGVMGPPVGTHEFTGPVHAVFGRTSDGDPVAMVDENGDVVWEFGDHDGEVRTVATDADSNVYFGSGPDAYKLDADGEMAWHHDGGLGWRNEVCAVSENALYLGEQFAGGGENQVFAVNLNGDLIWQSSDDIFDNDVASIDVSASGIVAVGTGGSGDDVLRLLSGDSGDVLHTLTISAHVRAVAIEPDASVIYYNQGSTLYARSGDLGSQLWSYDAHDGIIRGVTIDDNHVYSCGSDGTAHKLKKGEGLENDESRRVWSYDSDASTIHGISVDPHKFVYLATSSSTVSGEKISPDGEFVWSVDLDSAALDVQSTPGRYGAFPDHW